MYGCAEHKLKLQTEPIENAKHLINGGTCIDNEAEMKVPLHVSGTKSIPVVR